MKQFPISMSKVTRLVGRRGVEFEPELVNCNASLLPRRSQPSGRSPRIKYLCTMATALFAEERDDTLYLCRLRSLFRKLTKEGRGTGKKNQNTLRNEQGGARESILGHRVGAQGTQVNQMAAILKPMESKSMKLMGRRDRRLSGRPSLGAFLEEVQIRVDKSPAISKAVTSGRKINLFVVTP